MSFPSLFAALAVALSTTAAAAADLPAPDGAFAVGVVRSEFVDAGRLLDFSDPASGPRSLPVEIWYPARGPRGGHSPYLAPDAGGAMLKGLERTFRYSADDLKPVAEARVPVREEALPLRRRNAFPVVIFSHGLMLYPEQNSTLAARLASHGYIVVSVAHPMDAADQRIGQEHGHGHGHGRIVASHFDVSHDDPRLNVAFDTLVTGRGLADRRQALAIYAEAIAGTRIGRSLYEWRADTLAVAHAVVAGTMPDVAGRVLASADRSRLAFAGMSFGGATAATSCRLVPECRAAVNLDGQNFDPELFDASVGRPLLLVLSDWTRYGLFKGQSMDEAFSPNDLAYEPWASAGTDPDVLRVRLAGSRHLGLTDLVALLQGDKRAARVGDIDGQEALASVDDLILAFLDVRLRGADAGEIDQALRAHPVLHPHVPTRLQAWAAARP